jgi:bacteriocin-like protein
MPHELTEAELAQIQGGGLLGDAWRAVKKVGKKIGEAVIDAIEYLTKHPPITDWPPPGGPYPYPGY